jgi:hypothetical protein
MTAINATIKVLVACSLLASVGGCEIRTRPGSTTVQAGRACPPGHHLDRDHDRCIRNDHDHDHDHDRSD